MGYSPGRVLTCHSSLIYGSLDHSLQQAPPEKAESLSQNEREHDPDGLQGRVRDGAHEPRSRIVSGVYAGDSRKDARS